MKQNVKIAKKLIKLAKMLINESNSTEMYDKLCSNELDVTDRQDVLNYFMQSHDDLYQLLMESEGCLTKAERNQLLTKALNDESFDAEYFAKMIENKCYQNDNEKTLILNKIMNDEYYVEFILDLLNVNEKILSDEEKLGLFKVLIDKATTQEIIQGLLHSYARVNNEQIFELFLKLIKG